MLIPIICLDDELRHLVERNMAMNRSHNTPSSTSPMRSVATIPETLGHLYLECFLDCLIAYIVKPLSV
jgi:hypothetical protein